MRWRAPHYNQALTLIVVSLIVLPVLVALAVSGRPGLYAIILSLDLLLPILLSRVLGCRTSGLVVFAWAVRVALMAALKLYSYHNGLGGFYPGDADARAYHAWAEAAYPDANWVGSLKGMPPYTYVVAAIYRLFGPDINIPQFMNLGLSVSLVPVVYLLTQRVSGRRAASQATLLWCLLPSGLYWSVSLLKDIWVVAAILISAHFLVGLATANPSRGDLTAGLIGGGLLAFIRPQYVLALVAAAMATVVLNTSRFPRGRVVQAFLTLAALLILFAVSGASDSATEALEAAMSVDGFVHQATVALDGGSGIGFLVRFPPTVRWVVQLPFSLLAPFPWQWLTIGSGLNRLSGLEMALWYVFYFRMGRRIAALLADPGKRVIVIYAATLFVAVSFGIPNIGSMYRYRWPAVSLLLTLVPLAEAVPLSYTNAVSREAAL